MHRFICCLALIALAGFGQTPTAAKPDAAKAKSASAARGASGGASSDSALEAKIRAKFAASKISVDKFQVSVQGGVATITGHTDIVQHTGTATRLAKTAGATQVVNKIEVSQAAKDKAAANLSTGARRAQVKRSDVPDRK